MYKEKFQDYKDIFINSKKYWLIYLLLITIMGISTLSGRNFQNPTFEISIFIIVAILGIFCILFYFSHNSEEELYKVAFVIILCFGIICALIVPICEISDEVEHFTRSEITSQGVLIPHWTGDDVGIDRLYNHTDEGKYSQALNKDVGFETIKSLSPFNIDREKTVFDVGWDTNKIDYTKMIDGSAFEQNPFFGYLPQAFGIFIAKLLDLNVIWMMWLGRICNLICFAGLVSLAIRKTPVLKMPLLAVSCIPITIYQAASLSIDSMICGLGILAIAYFIYLCKSGEKSIELKDIAIFTFVCLLLGLCKITYLAFIFLLLFVPRKNFNFSKVIPISFASISIVSIIGILWSRYATPALMHSWRSKLNYVNSGDQIAYLLHNHGFAVKFITQIFTTDLGAMFYGVFNFFSSASKYHYASTYYLIVAMILLFLIMILLNYPEKNNFNLKTRLGSLFVLLFVYVGTCFVQLLTWAGVGYTGLGINTRYFIPLFALLPIIVNFKFFKLDKSKFDNYSFIFIIAFMAALILAFTTKYY
ncbi:DUF2142 domain-containing protein [uncultured Methanobrevibacter sp.]|uniref:DUF2142 domain-containing protein n=1 Tax=uncultured Methanobrevibacter sp. TaxID=253161 RepID=UPI0025FA964D|nr:DUF2142 domain-containing protein [uncultured Methanobrevibacter sp.]